MSVETVKKTKAAAKPRKTTTKAVAKTKAAASEAMTAAMPTHEEIAMLAQKYWAERGRQDGAAEQDWLRAERELLGFAS